MAVNPAGFVSPYDGGVPDTFTGIAIGSVSPGQFVHASGAADAVSSGLNSFAQSDIMITAGAANEKFNGIALTTATSGNYVSVVRRGTIITRAAGTIVNGEGVMANGSDAFVPVAVSSGADVPTMVDNGLSRKHGRALSNATSGNYTLVELTL